AEDVEGSVRPVAESLSHPSVPLRPRQVRGQGRCELRGLPRIARVHRSVREDAGPVARLWLRRGDPVEDRPGERLAPGGNCSVEDPHAFGSRVRARVAVERDEGIGADVVGDPAPHAEVDGDVVLTCHDYRRAYWLQGGFEGAGIIEDDVGLADALGDGARVRSAVARVNADEHIGLRCASGRRSRLRKTSRRAGNEMAPRRTFPGRGACWLYTVVRYV